MQKKIWGRYYYPHFINEENECYTEPWRWSGITETGWQKIPLGHSSRGSKRYRTNWSKSEQITIGKLKWCSDYINGWNERMNKHMVLVKCSSHRPSGSGGREEDYAQSKCREVNRKPDHRNKPWQRLWQKGCKVLAQEQAGVHVFGIVFIVVLYCIDILSLSPQDHTRDGQEGWADTESGNQWEGRHQLRLTCQGGRAIRHGLINKLRNVALELPRPCNGNQEQGWAPRGSRHRQKGWHSPEAGLADEDVWTESGGIRVGLQVRVLRAFRKKTDRQTEIVL